MGKMRADMKSSLVFVPEDDFDENRKCCDHNKDTLIEPPAEEIDDLGNTNLHNAVLENVDIDFLRQLLQLLPHQVNQRNREEQTPLHLAAMYGRNETIQILLDAGALLSYRDAEKRLAIEYAVIYNHSSATSLLCNASRDISVNISSLLHLAVKCGKFEVLSFFLLPIAQQCNRAPPATLLHAAIISGSRPIINLFLEHIPEAIHVEDEQHRLPLAHAIMNAQHDVIEMLIIAGAEIAFRNKMDLNALHFAAGSGDINTLEFVFTALGEQAIDALYSPAIGEVLPIDIAAGRKGTLECLQWFLQKMREIGRPPPYLHALRNAIQFGHMEIFRELLDFQIHSEYIYVLPPYREQQSNFLHIASEHGQTNVLCALLDMLSDTVVVNYRDFRSLTPLQHACRAGHVSVVRLLLKFGADSRVLTPRDRQAIQCNKESILALLDD